MDTLKFYLPVLVRDNGSTSFVALTLLCYSIYAASIVIHRLYLSPLAKFPGPRLAAATYVYEFYYNWWCQGKYIYEIEKMHNKYGMWARRPQHPLPNVSKD